MPNHIKENIPAIAQHIFKQVISSPDITCNTHKTIYLDNLIGNGSIRLNIRADHLDIAELNSPEEMHFAEFLVMCKAYVDNPHNPPDNATQKLAGYFTAKSAIVKPEITISCVRSYFSEPSEIPDNGIQAHLPAIAEHIWQQIISSKDIHCYTKQNINVDNIIGNHEITLIISNDRLWIYSQEKNSLNIDMISFQDFLKMCKTYVDNPANQKDPVILDLINVSKKFTDAHRCAGEKISISYMIGLKQADDKKTAACVAPDTGTINSVASVPQDADNSK